MRWLKNKSSDWINREKVAEGESEVEESDEEILDDGEWKEVEGSDKEGDGEELDEGQVNGDAIMKDGVEGQ